MTNPTSNFGWQMPTSTDLVTDLPADFEVFGQAVDTDFVDLLGGTTGQVLSKTTNTDLDFTWVTPQVGDITAVNVTSPITGGGSAGAVTIGIDAASTTVAGAVQLSDSTSTTSSVLASTPTATKAAYDLANTANTAAGAAQTTANAAIPKSTVTTAGDVIYATGSAAVTRLGIGTAGQVLTVNSGATAPEWAAAATPALVGCSIKRENTSTAITANTAFAIAFTAENFDTNAFHNDVTNNTRITIPTGKGGKYLISGFVNNALGSPGSYSFMSLYKNGAQLTGMGNREGQVVRGNGEGNLTFTQVVTLAAADYLEMYYQQGSTETVNMWFILSAIYLGA